MGQLHAKLSQYVLTYYGKNSVLDCVSFSNADKFARGMGIDLLQIMEISFSSLIRITVTFVINWKLTLILLCFLPVIIGSSHLFSTVCTCVVYSCSFYDL